MTLPNLPERRWCRFNRRERATIDATLDHQTLRHWFIESRDEMLPRASSLPLGQVLMNGDGDMIEVPPAATPHSEPPSSAFCAPRDRPGLQSEARRQVSTPGRHEWPSPVEGAIPRTWSSPSDETHAELPVAKDP